MSLGDDNNEDGNSLTCGCFVKINKRNVYNKKKEIYS